LEKVDKGGFERNKISPIPSFSKRGNIFYPPLKKVDKGGFERNKISPDPSFLKRGNYLSYHPP